MDVHGGPGLCSNVTMDNTSKYVCNGARFGRTLMSLLIYKRKTKIMASGPITSWHIDGGAMDTVKDFIFLGSKITVVGDCSHEIKRCFLLGRKAMTHLDSMLKSRDIILLIKIHIVKAMVFPVVMYGCESWSIKKAEC